MVGRGGSLTFSQKCYISNKRISLGMEISVVGRPEWMTGVTGWETRELEISQWHWASEVNVGLILVAVSFS